MIDNSFGIDFSRQVYQQNFLVGLVSNQIQANLNPQFTQFGRKAINSSPNVRQNLTKIITANLKDILETVEAASGEKVEYQGLSEDSLRTIVAYLVNKAVETVEVILPEPLTEDDEAANERISKLETRIDKVLEYMISPDILPPDVVGDKANSLLDSYRNILKADIMRSYFVNDGYGQEVLGYFAVGDDGKQPLKPINRSVIMPSWSLKHWLSSLKKVSTSLIRQKLYSIRMKSKRVRVVDLATAAVILTVAVTTPVMKVDSEEKVTSTSVETKPDGMYQVVKAIPWTVNPTNRN